MTEHDQKKKPAALPPRPAPAQDERPIPAPPIARAALRTPGQPLDAAARELMEPRFGRDFGDVRVHADARAAEAAEAVHALAYTAGQDVVFGTGQYAPGTSAGQALIAHELAHVAEQGRNVSSLQLQRQINFPGAQPQSIPPANLERIIKLSRLLAQITEETYRSIDLRGKLDALPSSSSESRDRIESNLGLTRKNLILLLGQRIDLLKKEIASLHSRIGSNPTSSSEHPEMSELGNEQTIRQRELQEHESQLRSLMRWQTRQSIQGIQTEIKQINREIFELPPQNPHAPTSDILDPRAQELINRRENLERQQQQQAKALTSTATSFKQTDPRWGSHRYGTSANCTNVAAAGCGPTSLAMLLNYLFQEDPEAASSGDLEMVRPSTTADYAATHGRICNNGTVGDTMVTNVHTEWPGFRGYRITLDQAAAYLRSGNLVIFLCKNCTGQNATGQNKTYGGHFMVLNGVNDDASQFNVIDPAGHNIVHISRSELSAHIAGLWTVVRK